MILQGNEDKEVALDGCSVVKKSQLLHNPLSRIKIIDKKGSNGHVSIVRKKGSQDINEDTMAIVDGFLYEIRP